MKKIALTGAVLLIALLANCAGASEAQMQKEIDDLHYTVQELQAEIDNLKKENKQQDVLVDERLKFMENIRLGADFRVRSVYAEGSDYSDRDSVSGFDQRLRIKFDYIDKSGVALRTRTLLYNNNWLGDRRETGGAGSDIDEGKDNIALDYGYIDIPFAQTWRFTAGRQVANWAFNFVTDDDRRDRLMLAKSFNGTAVGDIIALAIYDKRQEGLIDVYKDDGDMYAIATVTQTGNLQWGLLLDYWHGYADYENRYPDDPDAKDGYVLDDLWSFAPYIHSKSDTLEIIWALHYMDGNGRGDGVYEAGQGLWSNKSFSTFLRIGFDFHMFKTELQGFYLKDGALVGAGWDSFSCVIQNSPRNDTNPIRLSGVGGLGYDGDDQWLAAIRFSGDLFDEKVGWSLAGGYVDTENDDPDPRNLGQDNLYPISEYFFDVQASYRFLKTLELQGKFGIITGSEDDGVSSGAGRYGGLIGLTWNY